MHPVLFKPFGFAIYSYSAVLIVSFILSMMLAIYLGRRRGPLDSEYVQELAMWGIIWGLVGSRLGWVLWNFSEYMADPLRMFNLREGGMTILGGIILPSIVLTITCRRRGTDVRNVLDGFAGPLLLGMAIGRIGCVLHGCCQGALCDAGFPGALTYPQGTFSPGVPLGPRYPAQFFEAAADLVLMSGIIWLLPRIRFAGQAFWTTLMGYGLIRFCNEFVRADGKQMGILSLAQWVALGMFLFGIAGLLGMFGKPAVDVSWQTGHDEENKSGAGQPEASSDDAMKKKKKKKR
jgi:phosphatidylglycerol:prolipoprotein diacylglycerol transferase